MKPVVIAFPGNERLAGALADGLAADLGALVIRSFPDGETYVRLESPVEGRQVVLVCALDRPDAKFLPLIFTAAAAKDLGASEAGLVAPYLAYMRQDHRFQPGEAVTSATFAQALGGWADWLVTVDPHLHRRSDLSEIYAIPSAVVRAAPAIASWIGRSVENPLIIGPDRESEQWVAAVAAGAQAPFVMLEKRRRGDRDVEVSAPDMKPWRGRTPVIVDDIISTGRTMIETVARLREADAPPPVCIGVHAVFAGSAYADLEAEGAARIATCNTIAHPSNAIDVTPLIAEGVRAVLRPAGP